MLKIVLYQLFIRNWIANFSSISKKYIKFLFPSLPFRFIRSARIRYSNCRSRVRSTFEIAQPNGRPPTRFAPLSPPVKSFSRLCSTNWVATMTVSFHPQCSSVCEYTLEPRDHRDGAHISRLGGCKTAHIHGWRLHCLARVCARYAIILCRWWLTPPPTSITYLAEAPSFKFLESISSHFRTR